MAPDAADTKDGHPLSLSPQRVFAWPTDLAYQPQDGPRWLAPEPDGRAVAYGCRAGVCLVNISGVSIAAIPNAFPGDVQHHAVWRADGLLLVLVDAEKRGVPVSSYPWLSLIHISPSGALDTRRMVCRSRQRRSRRPSVRAPPGSLG